MTETRELKSPAPLVIAGTHLRSRLFIGTGKFGDHQLMVEAIRSADAQVVTVALRRMDYQNLQHDDFLPYLQQIPDLILVPNTSGAINSEEAVLLARLAREALQTTWIKLEIHPNPRDLMPDPIETLKAAEILVREGFVVLPYVHADPVLCRRLEEIGCAAVMPLGAPIGTNRGLETRYFLQMIREQVRIPLIVDAGIGSPSHAAEAMELGADAVLVNTAIATAENPVQMARAFKLAVEAGRLAYEAGLPPVRSHPEPTSPTSTPWTEILQEVDQLPAH